jgi:hypothetical protein
MNTKILGLTLSFIKIEKLIITSSVVLLAVLSAHAQTAFTNLNFESATVAPSEGDNYVPIAAALPGWNAYLGTTLQTEAYQNGYLGGSASINIFGPNYSSAGPQGPPFAPGIIDGNYTVFLQSGELGSELVNASIEQNGTIPAGTQSLEFKAWDWYPPAAIMAVSFNGNTLSPMAIGSGPNYTLYGANVSSFANQTGELEFAAVFTPAGPSWIEFDDISFSTSAVPEPNLAALSAMGGLLFGARKWLARSCLSSENRQSQLKEK